MEFNISKYLTEHVLTAQASRLGEDETDELELDMDEPKDDWNKPDEFDVADDEREPTTKDVAQQEPALSGIHKKQAQLKALTDQKDMILMQLKSGQLTLDQYKEKIGNIPQHIKRLKDQIDQAMNVSVDDSGEEEIG
jgi:hypothetical protein